MVPPNSTILRRLTALFSIVLLIFAAVSLYTTTSAAILVDRFLNNGRYAWAVVLMTSGEDRPGTQYMDLTYDNSSEIYLWVAAGSSLLASLLCIAKTGFDDWSRRRRDFDGMDHILPASRFSSLLSYTTASWILTAFTSTLVSAIYTWKHRLVVQQTTCHLELVKQPDALFRCTRELAVCDISPYLLKSDTSEHARVRRQEACGQLQFSRNTLLPSLLLLSIFLVIVYGVQIYHARRQQKSSVSVEEKIMSARSSSESHYRIEKVE